MTLTLYDTIRRIVSDEVGRVRTSELAVVQDQHPHADDGDTDNYACTVGLRDSGIVLKSVPVATGRIGTASIPAVGDLVLVQFLGGDVNAPVITGRFYNDEDRPPVNADAQAIMHLPLGAEDADAVHAELLSGETRAFTLALGEGLTLALRDDDPSVELMVGDKKATLAIAQSGALTLDVNDGKAKVTIEDAGKVTVDVGPGKTLFELLDGGGAKLDVGGNATLTLEQDGSVKLSSSAKLKLEASEIAIESQGSLKLKGATVEIN